VVRAAVLKRDEERCVYCGLPAITVDHVIPRSRGGSDDEDNLVACCSECNGGKGDKTPSEIGG
jgi:5-methylcytosine-specific restriction endonuclease McrA